MIRKSLSFDGGLENTFREYSEWLFYREKYSGLRKRETETAASECVRVRRWHQKLTLKWKNIEAEKIISKMNKSRTNRNRAKKFFASHSFFFISFAFAFAFFCLLEFFLCKYFQLFFFVVFTWKKKKFGRVMFCSLLFICLVLTHHICTSLLLKILFY